jgi:hypothetical protein
MSGELLVWALGRTSILPLGGFSTEAKELPYNRNMFTKLRRWLRWAVPAVFAVSLPCLVAAPLFAITQEGAGSGFIITDDGYILTNYHVVEDAADITVYLSDGRTFEAAVVDYSPTIADGGYDAALLKIAATDLPTLPLGDSDAVELFEEVIAIGYPLTFQLGVQLNASGGNVTSFRQDLFPDGPHVFQIDAAINPGNSGGPLLNMNGMVVGIPTLGISDYQGVNFAVPINHAWELVRRNLPRVTPGETASRSLTGQELVRTAMPAVVYIRVERQMDLGPLLPEELPRYEISALVPARWEDLESHGFLVNDAVAILGTHGEYTVRAAAIEFATEEDATRACRANNVIISESCTGPFLGFRMMLPAGKCIENPDDFQLSVEIRLGATVSQHRIARTWTLASGRAVPYSYCYTLTDCAHSSISGISYASAAVDARSAAQFGKVLVVVNLHWRSSQVCAMRVFCPCCDTQVYLRDGSIVFRETDRDCEIEKTVVATVEGLLGEFVSLMEYVYTRLL